MEEPSHQSSADVLKANLPNEGEPAPALHSDVSYTSNGVAELSVAAPHPAADSLYYDAVPAAPEPPLSPTFTQELPVDAISDANMTETSIVSETSDSQHTEEMLVETTAAVEHLLEDERLREHVHEELVEATEEICGVENEVIFEDYAVEGDSIDGPNETVGFKTEILIETGDNGVSLDSQDVTVQKQDNGSMLKDLSQGMELSEALRSSNTAENTENNNSAEKGEMFNKEELLDILEGNDIATSGNAGQGRKPKTQKDRESEIARKQLEKLKSTVRKHKKQIKKSQTVNKHIEPSANDKEDKNNENKITNNDDSNAEGKESESLVNSLVKDWDDDEPLEGDPQSADQSLVKEVDGILKATDEVIQSQEAVIQDKASAVAQAENPDNKSQATDANKSGDETQSRRFGRVIKKKVPFDPQNPDTFTKGKALSRSKVQPDTELSEVVAKGKAANKPKESPEKDHVTPMKKAKSESTPTCPKAKSPIAKSPWKKPNPKNSSKQNKRLTEVDKLLMDEGAVNMIYQLTPEAPKGRKNMRKKAEFIKKAQSSTPDGTEMKFRERKKDCKYDDLEARKILGGKPRTSLTSSVKSPSVSEDFEAHDSIIYRRHSSSSYSSSCMSPRRLSDGDVGASQNAARLPQQTGTAGNETQEKSKDTNVKQSNDIFMEDTGTETINKDDCLSIKEKLNSKLSQVLNKRKRESNKIDKPAKQKRVSKNQADCNDAQIEKIIKVEKIDIKHLSIKFEQKMVEISFKGTGSTIEVFKELNLALQHIDGRKDAFVTLLTSESGSLYSKLDLRSLLDDNLETRTNNAYEIAESIRVALCSLWRHSKLVVSGVWGACGNMAPALMALSDVALAGPNATFALHCKPHVPATTAILSSRRGILQSFVKELVLFDRTASCSEAQRSGLVDRILFPASASALRAAALELAAQSPQSLLLKKQMTNLKSSCESDTFLTSLEKERDMIVQYWTSVEGQDTIRATLEAS